MLIAVVITTFNGFTLWRNLWVSAGFGVPIVVMVNWVYRLNPNGREWNNNFIALVLGFAIGVLNLMAVIFTSHPESIAQLNVRVWIGNLVFSFAICLAVYYFFYTRYRMQCLRAEVLERQAQAADRERLLVQSQLQVLQSQIEPHFLFNTLANVQGLVDIEPTKAKQMIAALTQMLRANLQRTRATSTTLIEEFEIARCYLDIQSIRMGERLTYQLDLPETLQNCVVPPMLLQPLVENAITHGFERSTGPGQVVIRAKAQDQQLCLSVQDDGLGFVTGNAGSGVGLTNVRERLQSLYGDDASLTLTALAPHGVLAEIRLPRYGQ
ncbi:histidine kinase [Salinispirillum sp. LH 10-3-1]|uniref:Histidine kinase n=1 Tax=Salinispirillum sp. LH 10-3-1 TaxID=2952525 RepID=A0AB38YHV5_9GAMM